MHAGKGLAALHVDRVANDALAVGQMAAVPAGERTENLDILNRVLIGVAKSAVTRIGILVATT